MSSENRTGSVNVTVRGINLFLTDDEVVLLHNALFIAYGNEDRACPIYDRIRTIVGEDRWAKIVKESSGVS